MTKRGTTGATGVGIAPSKAGARAAREGEDSCDNYEGTNAAPPPGTPIGAYSTAAKGPPAPVTPGPKGKVKATFDGSRRM